MEVAGLTLDEKQAKLGMHSALVGIKHYLFIFSAQRGKLGIEVYSDNHVFSWPMLIMVERTFMYPP